MQKSLLFFVFIASFSLSACGLATPHGTPDQVPTATTTIIIPSTSPTQTICTNINVEPTPGPDVPSLFPPVSAVDYTRGANDAIVTIVVYNDFQCVDCNYLPMAQHLLEEHEGDIRFVYRPYPYTALFDKGELAVRAGEAADRQDKFWDMHDLLFVTQPEWVDLPVETFESWVTDRAAEIGLDRARFTVDFNSAETLERVKMDVEQGAKIGIPNLPFFLLNGQIYRGPADFEAFNQVINLIKLGERQFAACPAMVIDPSKQYIATLETKKGEIVLQLYPDKAPLAVNSFVYLAQKGWYDGITFHRVLPGFVAQTGDPSATGQGNPGYLFKNEVDPALTFNEAGMVGMANTGPDTNGSQFFITYAPAPNLDGSYTIFGKVISGMDVLAKLTPRDPQPGVHLPPGDPLIRVTVEEK